MEVKIPLELLEKWRKFSFSILDWRHKLSGDLLFKFLWQPEEGEFIFGHPPDNH